MTIEYTCTECKHKGRIDLHRTFMAGEKFHTRALRSQEEAALAGREASHQKDTRRTHELRGTFTVPKSLRKLRGGWLVRTARGLGRLSQL